MKPRIKKRPTPYEMYLKRFELVTNGKSLWNTDETILKLLISLLRNYLNVAGGQFEMSKEEKETIKTIISSFQEYMNNNFKDEELKTKIEEAFIKLGKILPTLWT
ncbi:hypothetical protein [Fusobacterium necrophorum]|jgi:hypothetical protein|uniref:hypothetical protein n=1 Tax=Fusobacterium necrophorum TaxID=859 RepID=UPI00241CB1C0|nr:hypothetical protein [Fusobacterium necrophorum]MDK4525122.1 hypothetical protein [Fusobacterium necrophorum]